jgi:hypothetical protein
MDATLTAESELNGNGSLPYSLLLELTITDAEVIAELCQRLEGRDRDDYALSALRLGILALKQARGQVDAQALKREGELLLKDVAQALTEHRTHLDSTLSKSLKEYFDPKSGRLNERIELLLKKDGELESLLARKITAADSEMCRALATHIGQGSPLFRLLSPNESEGLLAALSKCVKDQLESQRTTVLREFSLDNKDGALSRLVGQLCDHNGKLGENLQGQIDGLLKQFSFDDEQSALSRMSRAVAETNKAISSHLTLDDDNSALSRLKRELFSVLKTQSDSAQKFQEDVRATLEAMQARRKEMAASTRHGVDFESQVFSVVQAEAQHARDIATSCGQTTGLIKNCKKGDAVVEMGPDSPAPGAKIVVEAKESASFDLRSALAEIGEARANRGAECGIFVFSKKLAPSSLEPLARYGQDLIVVWDADDPASDIHLKLAQSVARALCTRAALAREHAAVDFTSIDKALAEIDKQIKELDEIRTWTETIKNNSDKILNRLRISQDKLRGAAEILGDRVADLKQSLVQGG